MSIQHAGYTITVVRTNAYNVYKYYVTSLKHHASGYIKANDEAEAQNKVMLLIDNDEV
jgi:hypothetical protein